MAAFGDTMLVACEMTWVSQAIIGISISLILYVGFSFMIKKDLGKSEYLEQDVLLVSN